MKNAIMHKYSLFINKLSYRSGYGMQIAVNKYEYIIRRLNPKFLWNQQIRPGSRSKPWIQRPSAPTVLLRGKP